MESLPSGRANSIPSGGWRSERPGARRRDDHVCEAMQLTCTHLPLPLCPIYLHRLCLFSDPANCPHRLRISSSSLFLSFTLPYLILLIFSVMTDDYSATTSRNAPPTLQRGKACLRCRSVQPVLPHRSSLMIHLSLAEREKW